MIRILFIIVISLPWCASVQSQSQSFSAILERVAANSPALRASRSEAQAMKEQGRVGLTLANPEAEVTHSLGVPRESVNDRTEISVTQEFDWATLTGSKRRVAQAEAALLDHNIDEQTRQLKERAALLLTEITYYNRLMLELRRRKETEEGLLNAYQKLYDKGEATAIDYNKARIAVMQINTEISTRQIERDGKLRDVRALAHDESICFDDTLYAVSPSSLPESFELWADAHLQNTPLRRITDQQVAISMAQTKLARSETLPTFSVGYAGELVRDNNYHGFKVGVTLPLWANSHKVTAARKAEIAADSQREALEIQQRDAYRQLFVEAKARQKLAAEYLDAIQHISNAPLLRKALNAGQMSLSEYLLEQKYLYETYDEWLVAERDAALAMVSLLAADF